MRDDVEGGESGDARLYDLVERVVVAVRRLRLSDDDVRRGGGKMRHFERCDIPRAVSVRWVHTKRDGDAVSVVVFGVLGVERDSVGARRGAARRHASVL